MRRIQIVIPGENCAKKAIQKIDEKTRYEEALIGQGYTCIKVKKGEKTLRIIFEENTRDIFLRDYTSDFLGVEILVEIFY